MLEIFRIFTKNAGNCPCDISQIFLHNVGKSEGGAGISCKLQEVTLIMTIFPALGLYIIIGLLVLFEACYKLYR